MGRLDAVEKTCQNCGGTFLGMSWARYCKPCARLVENNRRKGKYHYPARPKERIYHTGICRKCGQEFPSWHGQKYCYECLHDGSRDMTKYLKNRRDSDYVEKSSVCPVCKSEFFPIFTQKYCCTDCAAFAAKKRKLVRK